MCRVQIPPVFYSASDERGQRCPASETDFVSARTCLERDRYPTSCFGLWHDPGGHACPKPGQAAPRFNPRETLLPGPRARAVARGGGAAGGWDHFAAKGLDRSKWFQGALPLHPALVSDSGGGKNEEELAACKRHPTRGLMGNRARNQRAGCAVCEIRVCSEKNSSLRCSGAGREQPGGHVCMRPLF